MTIEVSAKKVEDAINQGLAQLGATLEDVSVEVVESGGLFRKAKVRLTLEKQSDKNDPPQKADEKAKAEAEKPAAQKSDKKEQSEEQAPPEKKAEAAVEEVKKPEAAVEEVKKPAAKKQKNDVPRQKKPQEKPEKTAANENAKPTPAKKKPEAQSAKPQEKKRTFGEEDEKARQQAIAFVNELIARMGFEATVEPDPDDGEKINVTAPAGDDSLIIGRHGETLSSLSYLAEVVLRTEKNHVNVTVDCNGYRARRAASLSGMAKRRADECVRKGRRIKLEPMERTDRRTVHNALGDDDRVTTASEGKEPYRFVVIYPKDKRGEARRNND